MITKQGHKVILNLVPIFPIIVSKRLARMYLAPGGHGLLVFVGQLDAGLRGDGAGGQALPALPPHGKLVPDGLDVWRELGKELVPFPALVLLKRKREY